MCLLNKKTDDGKPIKGTFSFMVRESDADQIAYDRFTEIYPQKNTGRVVVKFNLAIAYSVAGGITVTRGKHAYRLKIKGGIYSLKRTTK